MRRAGPVVLALSLFLYLALVPQACSDQTSGTVAPDLDVAATKGGKGKATLPDGADSEAKINKLIQALFPQPEKAQAHQIFAQITSALDDGDTEAAQDLMFDLLDLLLTTELNEPSDLSLADAEALLTDLLFEFVGLQAPDIDPGLIQDIQDGTVDGVVTVIEGDKDNTIITPGTQNTDGETGNTGLFVPDGALPDDEDYLLVVRELPVPCANTIFQQLPFCYEYETFPSPVVFNQGEEGIVAVCVDLDLPQVFASLIQDSDGVVDELPEKSPSKVDGFTCEPRGITDAGSSNPVVRLARAIFRPVTHLFDPPELVAINLSGMAGSIGSIDTRYVATVPQVIAKVSGDGQTGPVGSTLQSPLVVEVVHSHDGTPAAGVPVTFTVTGGGGSVSATTVTTDANGEAATTLTLGSSVGTNTVEASAPGTNLTGDPADPAGVVTFTATAGLPDLVVSNLTHSPTNPTELDQITFTAVVKNSGPGPAGPSTLMFTIGGETPGAPATLFSVPSLAAGATFTVQRQMTLIPQNYTNTATADYNEDVAETDENNNTTTDSYTVQEAGALGSATIDGVLSSGEWDDAVTYTFDANLPEGGTTPATLYVMNDGTDLYFALQFDRTSADPGNTFTVEFDKGGQGFTDVILVNPSLSPPLSDNFRTQTSAPTDVSDGGTNDGSGAFLNDGTHTTYEAAHPFDSSDDTHDLNLAIGDQVGIQVRLRLIDGTTADTAWPALGQFQQILIVSPPIVE